MSNINYNLFPKDFPKEFSAFKEIDSNEKYIITLTKKDYSCDGIKQINIFDFLMNDDF